MDGEDRLIAWLRRRTSSTLIGDDAAILPAGPFAITVDTQIAGVHVAVDPDPAAMARRLLAVNLSDLAAMGAQPAYAFLALMAPPSFDHRRFLTALTRAAGEAGVTLAGGDLAASPRAAAVLTLLGRRPRRGRWLRRDAARPNDALWVGGTLGEAALGLSLLQRGAAVRGRRIDLPAGLVSSRAEARAARRAVRRQILPTAQLALGTWLATKVRRCAAIDISDGCARDLHRLCRESEVGARIERERLPAARDNARLAARLDVSLQQAMLFGGEDYVLLFTLPPAVQPPSGTGCRRIGWIQATRRVELIAGNRRQPLPDRGFDHFTKP